MKVYKLYFFVYHYSTPLTFFCIIMHAIYSVYIGPIKQKITGPIAHATVDGMETCIFYSK